MNKTLFFLLIVLIASLCTSAEFAIFPNENISIIEGKWPSKATEINLFGAQNGVLHKIASSVSDAQGKFYFAFVPPSENIYVIGTNNSTKTNNYTFYFKPGDHLQVEIEEANLYRLVGQNTPENDEIERWNQHILSIAANSSGSQEAPMPTYVQIYRDNPVFNRIFGQLQKYDLSYNAVTQMLLSSGWTPQAIDVMKNFDLNDLTGSEFLDYPYGIRMVDYYARLAPAIHGENYSEQQLKVLKTREGKLDVLVPLMQNDLVKGEVVLSETSSIKSLEGYIEFEKKYGKYLVTEGQRERLKRVLKDIPVTGGDGRPAVDFKFPDVNGQEMALSDFKGKVVYIDVWATWCGPCLAQIPFLEKLEKEYHGKEVVFLGVSVDKDADRDKWIAMIKEKDMQGVQLFAGDKARIHLSDPYKITGIPRFILVGKDGNLISEDAPRPHMPGIKELLDTALDK